MPRYDEQTVRLIHQGRVKFIAMVVTYCLGVFNDSFFRESAMLMAEERGLSWLQGLLMSIFALPYILCAAYAGWLADRFAKRHVIIGAKLLELAAMLVGAVGILLMSWPAIVAMVFLMGLQSCIFSPSLNGSIPELYPGLYVTAANAKVKMVVTATILLGVAASGPVLHWQTPAVWGIPLGQVLVAVVVVGVSALGVFSSFGVPRRPAADPRRRFPWRGPIDTVRDLWEICKDHLLGVIIAADVFVWFVGAVFVPIINKLGISRFGSKRAASFLIAAEMVGVAIGGLLAARILHGPRWHRVLAPAALAMGVLMLAMSAAAWLPAGVELPAMFAIIGLIGVAGGVFMIPCEAFFQTRPVPERKGTVIASANCASFIGVVSSGAVAAALLELLAPTDCFAVVAVLAFAMAAWLAWALPRAARRDDNSRGIPLPTDGTDG